MLEALSTPLDFDDEVALGQRKHACNSPDEGGHVSPTPAPSNAAALPRSTTCIDCGIPGDRGHATHRPPSDPGSSGRLCTMSTLHRRRAAAHRRRIRAPRHRRRPELGVLHFGALHGRCDRHCRTQIGCTSFFYMKSDAHPSMHSDALKHFSQSLASFHHHHKVFFFLRRPSSQSFFFFLRGHHHKARQTIFPHGTLRFWPSPCSCEENEISKKKVRPNSLRVHPNDLGCIR